MNVRIEKLKPIRVAYMRHTGPYQECGKVWNKLAEWVKENGLSFADRISIGASYDDPSTTPPEKLRYDCCIEIDDDFKPDDQVQVKIFEGGKYALFTHVGQYMKIGESFQKLFHEWFPQSGREYRMDACFEIYRGDHEHIPEDERTTDLLIPVK
jgi:AraC family transcriptional regulator